MKALRRRFGVRLFWLALLCQLLTPMLHAAGMQSAGMRADGAFCSPASAQLQQRLIAALPAEVREHLAANSAHRSNFCDHCIGTGAAALPPRPQASVAAGTVDSPPPADPVVVPGTLASLLPPATGPPSQP